MLKNRLWANLWVGFLVVAGALAGLMAGGYFLGGQPVTTVILVRHAEKNIEPDNPNPALSPAGQERAQTLVRVLGESGITAIYATQYLRTQGTASPLADRLGLKVNQLDARNVEELVRQIKSHHSGDVVFVAGHSNSVPAVMSALGGGALPELPEQEYDNMFVVTLQRFRPTRVVKLKYGNPSPRQ
ncbi:MAG: histidine phosphatase family protein [Pyrinomonadaceae bacterium]|nr:histidine phosphatase family protein [Pyrinomonadaceae bacterium]